MSSPARTDRPPGHDDRPNCLDGGGEMGAALRAHDWAATGLGAPLRWPVALRAAVRLMLASDAPAFVCWGPGCALLLNDACRELCGARWPPEPGRDAARVFGPMWAGIAAQIEPAWAGHSTTWLDADWAWRATAIDDTGGIGGVLVICAERVDAAAEAAARQRAEAALRESEARFRSALSAGQMGSWETDYASKTRTWSAEGMALFGLDLADGRGQVDGEADEYVRALHPDDRHLARRFRELADSQDSFAAEYRIVKRDGTTLWLSGRGLVVEREPDGHARRLVSIMSDATERKLSEIRLQVERERLALALSAGRMGVFDLNIADGVLWWSLQTYHLHGVDPARFVPTPESVLLLVHPDDRHEFEARRAEAIAQRRPFEHEFRTSGLDRASGWVAIRGRADYDAGGKPIRSFGIVMDITERKRVEQVLRDADVAKDQFIAILAHELRNPLAPIRNAIQLLQRLPSEDARVAACLDAIDRQSEQMARLLDDLLDVSLISRNQLRIRRERLALNDVLRQAIQIAQPQIDAGAHALTVTMPEQTLSVDGDATRLTQVFSNVLINAAKYTPDGGRINLNIEPQGHVVSIRVADNGIGIASEHMARIFTMFGQVQSALNRSHGGQGIGLSLARGLIELHGGTIAAVSLGPGHGSEFEIRLPLVVDAAPAAAPDAAPLIAPRDGPGAEPALRILIADDMQDITDTLKLLLSDLGHEVEVAHDGDRALALAESFRPDVALLDLGMPNGNGYEVCRSIRAAPWGQRMTLIAQTGWGQDDDRRRTREAGFDHHVVKPVDLETLCDLIQRARLPRVIA